MTLEGKRVSSFCPLCGKKMVGTVMEHGIVRLTCRNCKTIATSKYTCRTKMEIKISFLQTTES